MPEKNYQEPRKRAALKQKSEKTFSIEKARPYSQKMIRKWASELSFQKEFIGIY